MWDYLVILDDLKASYSAYVLKKASTRSSKIEVPMIFSLRISVRVKLMLSFKFIKFFEEYTNNSLIHSHNLHHITIIKVCLIRQIVPCDSLLEAPGCNNHEEGLNDFGRMTLIAASITSFVTTGWMSFLLPGEEEYGFLGGVNSTE